MAAPSERKQTSIRADTPQALKFVAATEGSIKSGHSTAVHACLLMVEELGQHEAAQGLQPTQGRGSRA